MFPSGALGILIIMSITQDWDYRLELQYTTRIGWVLIISIRSGSSSVGSAMMHCHGSTSARSEHTKPLGRDFMATLLGLGISWLLTIRFDSDSEVNDSILNRFSILNRLSIINSKPIKLLSMHLVFLKHLSLLLRASNRFLLCVCSFKKINR